MIYILWATARLEVFKKNHLKWLEKTRHHDRVRIKVAVDSKEHRAKLLGFDVTVVKNPRNGITTPLYALTSSLQADDNDIIVVASDDFFPPDEWVQYLESKFENYDGCLWVNDGHGKEIISIPIMSFSCLKKLNRIIYHPIYNHLFSDQELWDILHQRKMMRDCRTDVKEFHHDHPLFNGNKADEVNKKNDAKFYLNKLIYKSRKNLTVESKLKMKRLSILICSLADRHESLARLVNHLESQSTDEVEIRTCVDNGEMQTGEKRNKLIRESVGEYVVFVDDDDTVSDNYVTRILQGIRDCPDVVGITVQMTVNGKSPKLGYCSIKYKKWETVKDKRNKTVYHRTPHHLCPIRREIALKVPFKEITFGEDRAYSNELYPHLKTEYFIEEPIYFYNYIKKKKKYPKFKSSVISANYYSQIGQDKFIREHFLPNETNGFFVEIGAYDGKLFSNSLHFEESGWNGICVEPNPEMFKLLEKNRSCLNFKTCVWDKKSVVDFMTVKGVPANEECKMLTGIQSTMDERHKDRFIQAAGSAEIKTIQVKSMTLAQLLDLAEVTHVNYCSLDTEGSEFDILKAFDFDNYQVDIFSVENNYNENPIREFMRTKGYGCHKLQWDDIYYKI